MQKLWTDEAWDDYLYWQSNDKKTLKRINQLINNLALKSEVVVLIRYLYSGFNPL
jgi:Txe/YoeB family toxin of Txe-Axe toxin-antitoxin module